MYQKMSVISWEDAVNIIGKEDPNTLLYDDNYAYTIMFDFDSNPHIFFWAYINGGLFGFAALDKIKNRSIPFDFLEEPSLEEIKRQFARMSRIENKTQVLIANALKQYFAAKRSMADLKDEDFELYSKLVRDVRILNSYLIKKSRKLEEMRRIVQYKGNFFDYMVERRLQYFVNMRMAAKLRGDIQTAHEYMLCIARTMNIKAADDASYL